MKYLVFLLIFVSNLFSGVKKVDEFFGRNAIFFNLPDIEGKKYSLDDLRFKNKKVNVVMLVFFDTKCQPCIKELPSIKKLYENYKDKDVIIRMVSIGEDAKKVKDFIKKYSLNIPVLLDKSTLVAGKYGVVEGQLKKIPQIFVIGKSGKIIKHLKGYHKGVFEVLSRIFDKELKKKVSLIKKDEIEVFYTSSASGELISCDCPTQPFGGLDRRLTYISKNRTPNALVFDTGDFFTPYKDKLKNEYVLKFMDNINYDAITIGDQEFATGIDYFLDEISKYNIPIVIGNLQVCKDNLCMIIGRPYIIKEINGFKVGITGVISEKVFFLFPKEIKDNLKFTQTPEEFLKEVIPEMRKEADFIFVLSHQGDYMDRELVKKVKGIDVIFGGHSQSKIAEKINNTIILQPGEKGMYVGKVVFKIKNKKILLYKNQLIPLTKDIVANSIAKKLVKEYKRKLKEFLKTKTR